MSRQLYELRIAQDRAPSPFVWRALMCLKHKGLPVQRVGIGYGEKPRIAFSGQDRVPVLVDAERVVPDSFAIAEYLEDAYPDAPALFGGGIARGQALLLNRFADMVLLRSLRFACWPGTYDLTPAADQPYFWQNRLEISGLTIDQMRPLLESEIAAHRTTLEPVRQTLGKQPWLSGEAPAWADYCVFGGFMWARTVLDAPLVAADDPIEAWRQRMLDLFDGFARNEPGFDV